MFLPTFLNLEHEQVSRFFNLTTDLEADVKKTLWGCHQQSEKAESTPGQMIVVFFSQQINGKKEKKVGEPFFVVV